MKKFLLVAGFAFTGVTLFAQDTNPEELFKSIDIDGNEVVTLTEYSAYIAKSWNLNGDSAPSDSAGSSIIEEFKKYDSDDDGNVTLEEFKANYE